MVGDYFLCGDETCFEDAFEYCLEDVLRAVLTVLRVDFDRLFMYWEETRLVSVVCMELLFLATAFLALPFRIDGDLIFGEKFLTFFLDNDESYLDMGLLTFFTGVICISTSSTGWPPFVNRYVTSRHI